MPVERNEYYKEWRKKNPDAFKNWVKANPERAAERHVRWDANNPERRWASASLSNHRSKGYDVQITTDELEEMLKNTPECPYCGCKFTIGRGSGKILSSSASLDRIDNGKTLTIDNTEIICYKCNRTKSDRTLAEFIEYCRRIVTKYG